MFTELSSISKPLFSTPPKLAQTQLYPVTFGNVRLTNTSDVFDLYTSNEPFRRWLKRPKSIPKFHEEVRSHFKSLLAIAEGYKEITLSSL